MATIAQNNELKPLDGRVLEYPILKDGTADINAGDNVYWDSSAKVVKALDSDAHGATYAGVSCDTTYSNLYGTKKYMTALPVRIKGIHLFTSVNGVTYNHGDAVYFSTDAQTVTSTDPGAGHSIGKVWLQNSQSAIVGDGTKKVPILVLPQFPVASGL